MPYSPTGEPYFVDTSPAVSSRDGHGVWVSREDALLYGKACRVHSRAWSTAWLGIFLLGVVFGPVSVVRGLSARAKSRRSGVKTLGFGPVVFGSFVTVWGIVVLVMAVQFFSAMSARLDRIEQQYMSGGVSASQSELSPGGLMDTVKNILGVAGVGAGGDGFTSVSAASAAMQVNAAAGGAVSFDGVTMSSVRTSDGLPLDGASVTLPAGSEVVVNGVAVTAKPVPVPSETEWCVSVPSGTGFLVVDDTATFPQMYSNSCLDTKRG